MKESAKGQFFENLSQNSHFHNFKAILAAVFLVKKAFKIFEPKIHLESKLKVKARKRNIESHSPSDLSFEVQSWHHIIPKISDQLVFLAFI